MPTSQFSYAFIFLPLLIIIRIYKEVICAYYTQKMKKVDDGFPAKLIHTVRGAGYVIREENN